MSGSGEIGKIKAVMGLGEEYSEAYRRAAEVLKSGGVLIYPTDTVYGIGGDARREEVVERIRKIKGRGEEVPFSVILGNLAMVEEYVDAKEDIRYVMEAFPGAVTLILRARKELPFARNGKIGVRVPEHSFMRRLSMELGMPIITTSANPSGGKPPTSVSEIDPAVLEKADLVIDGGKTLYGMPSTILDVVERKVVRVGAGEIII